MNASATNFMFPLRLIRGAIRLKWSRLRRHKHNPSPLFMVWEATEKCNSHCSYCVSGRIDSGGEDELNEGEIESVIDQAVAMGICGLVITGGGEPLMRNDLPGIIRHAKSSGLWVALTTNGTLINDGNVRDVLEADLITVSIDSINPADYFERRGIDSFAAVENTLDLLRRQNRYTYLTVQSVIDSANWMDILKYNEYFHYRGFDSAFQLLYGARFGIEKKTWWNLVRKLKYHRWTTRYIHRKFLLQFPYIASGGVGVPCSAGASHFVISADGRLNVCNTLRMPGISLRERSLQNAWRKISDLRKYIDSPQRECVYGNSCFIPLAQFI